MVVGQVVSGINNIYQVRVSLKGFYLEKNPLAPCSDFRLIECRIKGKVLSEKDRSYNPIAPGDRVFISIDLQSPDKGWILEKKKRYSAVRRWNRKRQAIQTMAANIELLLAVTTVKSPPFRPRFIDRVLLAGELSGVEPVIILNKVDLGKNDQIVKRINYYRKINYRIFECSTVTGEGLENLSHNLRNKGMSVLIGQSGVGKSSILNSLDKSLNRSVGDISSKHDRGVHTTRFGEMIQTTSGQLIIDTPGIREFQVTDIEPHELRLWYRDFLPFVEKCHLPSCLCVQEPGCSVRLALESGKIHPDRYLGYCRLLKDLQDAKSERR